MDKGAKIYKDFIDELVDMSRRCAHEGRIRIGHDPWNNAMNAILEKLDDRERTVLANYVLDAYHSAIHDTLFRLEEMRWNLDMTITADGALLPIGDYEGIHCDYIGRREDWEWPDE